ncbi:hypothetical protein MHB50_05320 [Siminovitchia sp. FSL H7-0308]|uniref:Sporulation protein YjcZ n=1 Tax=Siminovitchia thermophila TaxID=1245522 RepID=A0ABS2R335_9BACI|nr:hypothetical protein [Siminovitchia thermophila]MBM7713569.1 hypothetical protein [Siminovitchia thermophila]
MMHGYGYGGMMGGFGVLGYIIHLLLTGIVVYIAVKLAMKK